jgi:hypothetical protein
MQRQREYKNLAEMHASLKTIAQQQKKFLDQGASSIEQHNVSATALHNAAAKAGVTANYHESMRRKYERASSQPWLPFETEPPSP